jgi:ankyrin repeat protein
LEALLDAGANPNVRDDLGRTAMHYIVQHNHKPLIRILAERGADIDIRDNENTSPAGLAISNRKRAAYLYLVEELGARWGMPDTSRRSPPRP